MQLTVANLTASWLAIPKHPWLASYTQLLPHTYSVVVRATSISTVLHQGPEEDRKEDIVDAHMKMAENPSYVHNTVTLTPHYQSVSLHDKLDCTIY